MTDRPIIFSAPMVRALLDGRKSQTRRLLKPQPTLPWGSASHAGKSWWTHDSLNGDVIEMWRLRYAVGDRLYVREAHALVPASAYRMSDGVEQIVNPTDADRACVYAEGWERCKPRWRPSIHMPRWASRLTLTVTDVRVQRLQEISEADAVAEGIQPNGRGWWTGAEGQAGDTPRAAYSLLWNSLHGAGAWAANPWVVAVSFRVQHGNIDRLPDPRKG